MSTYKAKNFIEQIIEKDIEEGKHSGRVHTRFPPEPNGYLHIGHAKAICLNFGVAESYGGITNLRFDDTNPTAEDIEYVNAIKEDIKWLGFDWGNREYYTSDYFDFLYLYAQGLIRDGKAYIDESTPEELAIQKGTVEKAGTNSPFRNRPSTESLELFAQMKAGEIEEGKMALRAKIDMSSPNMHMRDPIIYRVKNATHHRTGDTWKIYPMYDFAHGQSDSIEKITHSLCSLEFENHRPLYDWFISELEIFPSRQIEFSRLNMTYTIMSKRKLRRLVEEKVVDAWDDPRMPTLAGLRRRGYTPESIKKFIEQAGLTKRQQTIDLSLLDFYLREHLNEVAQRRMIVENPLKVIITNYPEDQVEELVAENNPQNEADGKRTMPFSREIYIEREDFMEDPPKKYFRMSVDRNVRLKHAYILHCDSFDKDPETGEITCVYATYYPASKSGQDTSGIKAKGTMHFVSAAQAVDVEIRNYDRLFSDPEPDGHKDKDFMEFINPDSLHIVKNAKAEPAIQFVQPMTHFQLLRKGYFVVDKDSTAENIVLNKIVSLRDSWTKK